MLVVIGMLAHLCHRSRRLVLSPKKETCRRIELTDHCAPFRKRNSIISSVRTPPEVAIAQANEFTDLAYRSGIDKAQGLRPRPDKFQVI